MTILLHVLILAEMLCVNLGAFHHCSKKKYSDARTLGAFFLFSLLLVAVLMPVLRRTQGYGNGNGLFALAGFAYLIPIHFLYDQPLRRSLSLVFSVWTYTMFAFAVGVQVAKYAPEADFALAALTAQTVFYVLTLPAFIWFVRRKLVALVRNIPEEARPYLRWMSLCWFGTALFLNFTFVYHEIRLLKLLALLLLIWDAVLGYLLICAMANSLWKMEKLKQIVYLDSLTGLKNRSGLLQEAGARLEAGTAFDLIFMDLDHFKSINDRYGHMEGDRYLCAFVQCFRDQLDLGEHLYRVAGDEFVCLCAPGRGAVLTAEAEDRIRAYFPGVAGFLGVSMGVAAYPADGRELDRIIATADQRMYQDKEDSVERRGD